MATSPSALLDSGERRHIVSGMLHRLIASAMSAAIREQVTPMFVELTTRMDRLEAKMDRLEAKSEATAHRLESRIDDLTSQQFRMVEQIANLRVSVDLATTVSHRIDRLEDRVFAKAQRECLYSRGTLTCRRRADTRHIPSV